MSSRSEAGTGQGSAAHRQESQPLAWLHARLRLAPRVLDQAPAWVRDIFEHDWAPAEALLAHARRLPAALWDYLSSCKGGFVVLSPRESCYAPGAYEIRGRILENVALISVQDLALDNERPLHVLGHLADHYLGCGGDAEGAWLSAGGGMAGSWQQAGERLAALYALGYAVDDVAAAGVRDYLAQSLAVYCRDRRRLNVADPQMDKWLRTTIFDESFWESKERY